MNSQFPTRPFARLGGHKGSVHAVTYSAGTSQYILTGASDRTIRLFNPAKAPSPSDPAPTGRPPGLVQEYSAHGYEVLDICVDPSNETFLSVGGDKTVFWWDVQTAQTRQRFFGHAGRINACAFGGDDASVAVTGSFDGTVRLWDLKSRSSKPLMTLSEAKDSVTDVVVMGKEILSASVDGRVRAYDVRTGRGTTDVIGHPVTSLSPTKDMQSVLVSGLDSTVRLMDHSNGQLLKAYRDPKFVNTEYRLRSTLGMNESVVLSGSDDGLIFVWDLLEGSVLHRLRHSQTQTSTADKKKAVVSAVAYCKTRKEWASAGGDGNVIVWGMP